MRAGRLRQRVALQSKTYSQDSYGAVTPSWSTQATVWAAIEPLTGREWLQQGQRQDEATVRIVIRYRPDVTTEWRVKHTDYSTSPGTVRYYNIYEVQNENTRDRMLILMTRQGLSEDETGDTDDTNYVVNSGTYVVNSGIQVIRTP